MPLDANALLTFTNGLSALFVATAVPGAPSTAFAAPFAALYKTYALNALSCAAAPPSLVFDFKLKARVQEGLDVGTSVGAAAKWALGFKEFWQGALFGPTGLVPPGKEGAYGSLETALSSLWASQAASMTLFIASAQQHATLIETYTKTVEAKDTALPSLPGCGPNPIT